jgi:hypothetical protein
MKYRPEYQLDRLRCITSSESVSDAAAGRGSEHQRTATRRPCLHFRWLRTIVVDLSRMPKKQPQRAVERLALQQRAVIGCAAERVVGKRLSEDHLSHMLSFLRQCVPLLTSLDLRTCADRSVCDKFLLVVAEHHSLTMRRMCLPAHCDFSQSTLDHFTQLEELDVNWCTNVTTVDFCSATLRVLYANYCYDLTDHGLRNATRLEVLHVSNCPNVTDVTPFAECLVELDASRCCGINTAALSECRRLQVLHAYNNSKITSLRPFAHRLRELDAGGFSSSLNDATLADATRLVHLNANYNVAIKTVEPFGASLRELHARYTEMDVSGLRTAANLVSLDAAQNSRIRSLGPCAFRLLELRTMAIGDAALQLTTHLMLLEVSGNIGLSTVEPCGISLRHLVAQNDCGALTDQGLATATNLVTLDCRGNSKLTSILPFQHTLQQMWTHSHSQINEIDKAPLVHHVGTLHAIPPPRALTRLGFIYCGTALHDDNDNRAGECQWFRDTVQYPHGAQSHEHKPKPISERCILS